jgi:hypothetical protein
MNINEIFGGAFGNVYPFPGQHPSVHSSGGDFGLFQQQCREYAAMRPVSVPSPEELKQWEITSKNKINYERWLARIMREPLEDVSFK